VSTEGFSPDWLRMREPFDHSARASSLALRLADVLPPGASLMDLGCGRGSNTRYVAPFLAERSYWCLVDHDARLLDCAEVAVAEWAARHPEHAPLGVTMRQLDLRASLPEEPCDAVITQAVLDLVSDAWLVSLADWLQERQVPFLAALTVDGRVAWAPVHSLDAEVQAAFRAHQRLDRGFGPSPGPAAAGRMVELLEQRGFQVWTERADWVVPPESTEMLRFMVDGTAEAAGVTHPDPAIVRAWHSQRMADVAAARVALRVGHLDLLALPG